MCEAFILRIEQNLSQKRYEELLRLVSSEKRARIGRFHRYEDAQRTLMGDVLIRVLIRNRLTMQNSDIAFNKNEYGKPFLVNFPDFHFNISHAGSYVTCAIDDQPVGIDVEEIKPIDLKIAERFFAQTEKEYIFSQSEMAKNRAFFQIWTMKESYIKQDGKGLSIPLKSFSVLGVPDIFFHNIFENEKVVCNVCTTQPSVPSVKQITMDDILSWNFYTNSPTDFTSRPYHNF